MKKILVVEDDPDISELLHEILITGGYEVSNFDTPIKIEQIRSIKPDLILLDHVLPEETGGDYCRRIKANQETARIPTIIISANMYIDRIAKNACADDYITKPFDVDELVSMIKKWTK